MKTLISCVALILVSVDMEKAAVAKSGCSMTNPCTDLGAGADFQEPTQVCSHMSHWATKLEVDIGTTTYNWLNLKRRLYNGEACGPTITVKRGDQFDLTLVNKLSPNGNNNGNPMNKQRFPNSTNIHTHGLHISSEVGQDNVLIAIPPQNYFLYTYEILQQNVPGTYWYHAHVHGSTAFQVNGGLAGMLIVADDDKDMPRELIAASCPSHCENDIQLLFQPLLYFGGRSGYAKFQKSIGDYEGFTTDHYKVPGFGTLTDWLAKKVSYVTTNGQFQPKLSMKTGQLYRFRMANAAGHPNLAMYITGDAIDTPTTNCQIREIALDGIYLPTPRKPRTGQSLIVPGGRVDWLVFCSVPGQYKLASYNRAVNSLSLGIGEQYSDVLVTLDVSGKAKTGSFPKTLPHIFHNSTLNIDEKDIKGRFVVEMGPNVNINRELLSHPVKYRYKMRLNEVQEWTLVNANTELTHPLHIHVNPFQIVSYNKYTGAFAGFDMQQSGTYYLNGVTDINKMCFHQHEGFTGHICNDAWAGDDPLKYLGHNDRFHDADGTLGYAQIGDWKDTLLLPPLVNVTVRFKPTELTGDVVIHCHILRHEDAGMMMVVAIVPEGGDTTADIKSGGANPGTCAKCDRYPPNNPKNLCGETDHGKNHKAAVSSSHLGSPFGPLSGRIHSYHPF